MTYDVTNVVEDDATTTATGVTSPEITGGALRSALSLGALAAFALAFLL